MQQMDAARALLREMPDASVPEHFMCPVCYSALVKPHTVCTNGHNMCSD